MVRIVISGALGRMGKRIIALAEKDPDLKIVGKLEKDAHPDSGIVNSLKSLKGQYDCIIEFTAPEATAEHVKIAKLERKAMVIGTTGLSEKERLAIKEASEDIPVVFSPNMSVGVNMFLNLIEKGAKFLGKDYRASIKEAHHTHKKDKPSGTAKLMAEIIKGASDNRDVPIESLREGEIVGDHDITFESETDTIKISHSAKTRDIFALGALKAAKFVATKKNGLFSMSDVLGL